MNIVPGFIVSNESSKSIEDPGISLGLLEQIETNSGVTQRGMANELGIALGLVNLYIKRCMKKGWIKATQVPANRYAYYLTPKGLQEKSRLTAEYLSTSLNFFRLARREMNEMFESCRNDGLRKVVLVGVSDFAEIAVLSSHEVEDVSVIAIIDPRQSCKSFLGLPVLASFDSLPEFDVAIITSMTAPQAAYDEVVDEIGENRVRASKILRLSMRAAGPQDRNGGLNA